MTVIAIANHKGGTAKTTSAVNIAAELARAGRRVLLIDLDPQGHVARSLGLQALAYSPERPGGPCVSFLLEGARSLKASILPAGKGRGDLFVVPATNRVRYVGRKLAAIDAVMSADDPEHVALADALTVRLGNAPTVFHFIIFDCPPNLDLLRSAVYNIADRVIVPVKVDDLSVDGLRQQVQDLNGARARLWKVLPTMYRERQRIDRYALDSLMRTFGRWVAEPVPELVAVKEAPNAGQTLAEYAPDSAATLAYRALSMSLLEAR